MAPYKECVNAMNESTRIVALGPSEGTVRTAEGEVLQVPTGWELLPPGDAGLTRRVKSSGPTWTVQEKKGRKLFSRGVWAPRAHISSAKAALEGERGTESYAKRRQAAAVRRQRDQDEYVEVFSQAVQKFLAFHERYAALEQRLAIAIAAHATPIGSGTVARTERIPVAERAESAVIAWLRHQTTGYDDMRIERVKGKRREVRRMLAQRSRELLEKYRMGKPLPDCPLTLALSQPVDTPSPPKPS
jgi:hypothetical protein